MKKFIHYKLKPNQKIHSLAKQQRFRCYYCKAFVSTEDRTVDHKVPKSRGGSHTSRKNLCMSCKDCNKKKGSMTVEEFLAQIDLERYSRMLNAWGRPSYTDGCYAP